MKTGLPDARRSVAIGIIATPRAMKACGPARLLARIALFCLFGLIAMRSTSAQEPPGAWQIEVQRSLAEREYHASHNGSGLQAPNRAQGFRSYFNVDGVSIVRRDVDADPIASIRLVEYGHAGERHSVGPAIPTSSDERVTLDQAGVITRYKNQPDGLSLEFSIVERPVGAGPTTLRLKIDAGSMLTRGEGFVLVGGSTTLALDGLAATDANGHDLPLTHQLGDHELQIHVDDDVAGYPITIKSVISGSNDALLQSNQANASFGISVAGAGDVNGDGFSDVIVGAYTYDNGQGNEGAAFVYFGSAGSFNTSADALLDSNQDSALFGHSVAGAGDVNGDGFADVLVGATAYDNGEEDEGAAFVYFGGSGPFNTTADALLEANQAFTQYGISLASAGDVNGDGYADIIVGANNFSQGQIEEGAAFLYLGGAGTFNTAPHAQLQVNQDSAFFGVSVSGAGDLNGDGYADLIIGADGFQNGQAGEGAAFVYFGGAGPFDTNADAQLEVNQVSARFGASVAGAGDVNGDGFADVIVGANGYDNGQSNEGAAFIFLGGSGTFNATPDALLESNQAGATFGRSVAGAGDINGDGYADVIVGANAYSNGQSSEGAAYVFFGGSGTFDPFVDALLESNQSGAQLGYSVAEAGDVNGDGYADVIVGAYKFDSGESDEGTAFLYFGSTANFPTTADAVLMSPQESSRLGSSVSGAGDVNGDGFADIIVGASAYDNGLADEGIALVYFGGPGPFDRNADALLEVDQIGAYFGSSVAGAGDVNGDGYADVIVGAPFFDNGQTNEGAAFLFHGGAGAFDTLADAQLEIDQAIALNGTSVAGAGDVNGDGYADVLVGAFRYDDPQVDEGAAFLYLGTASGIGDSPAAVLQTNQSNAFMGLSVAGAGDVNGDGFADIIVGSPNYTSSHAGQGAAYFYFGSAGSFDSTFDTLLTVAQTEANFGISVASAGDVNGDGHDDVIVGANGFTAGQTNEGAAFLYLGSNGPFSAAAHVFIDGDQTNARFGNSVAGAGDVNGDGFADILIGSSGHDSGQSDEGIAFLYLGGAGTFNVTDDARLQINQAYADFGFSVAGAGDLNGDGFSDVVIGAPLFDNTQTQEGAAFIHYGSERGRPVLASQFKGDASSPVQAWGLSEQNDGFVVSVVGSSPRGRERAKLRVEACPNGVPFGSPLCDIRTSAAWTELAANSQGTTLALSLSGLNNNRLYHWRARLLYAPLSVTATGISAPPNPMSGPWRRVQGNASNADIRIKLGLGRIFADGFE